METFNILWFKVITGTTIGLVLGSFATMLAYRLPRGISIISPPSHCPHCKARLTPRDLIPVFSWLINKGNCRHCGHKIGTRYLMIEIIITLVCVGIFVIL